MNDITSTVFHITATPVEAGQLQVGLAGGRDGAFRIDWVKRLPMRLNAWLLSRHSGQDSAGGVGGV